MPRPATSALAGLLAALCFPPGGAAQVTRTQDGRALDASILVGSGRINTPVAPRLRLDSQLYVNGQVTGLARFRGRVGYYPSDSLRLALPSSALSRFFQQSADLETALAGAGFRPAPYYDRSATVFGAGGIAAGRTAPGSSVPRTSTGGSALARKLYDEAQADYAPLAPSRLYPLAPIGDAPGLSPLDLRAGGLARPGATDVFAGHRPGEPLAAPYDPYALRRDPAPAAREDRPRVLVRDPQTPPGIEPTQTPPEPPGRAGRPEQPFPGAVRPSGPREEAAPASPDASKPPSGAQPAVRTDTPQQEAPARRPGPLAGVDSPARPPAADRLPEPNQDVFVDLLVALKQRRGRRVPTPPRGAPPAKPGAIPVLPARPATTQPSDLSAADGLAGRRGLEYPPPPRRPAGSQAGDTKYIELTEGRKILIHRLAGRGRDEFNRRMASAQQKLRAGRYYDAAADYELAAALDPGNPLATLGSALALFFAGEPISSAAFLRQAMEQFPALMEARLNLPNMVDPRAIPQQLDRLRKRLATTSAGGRAMMLFLAAYMHLNAGREAHAGIYARQLRESAGLDTLGRAYADYVLTGKRPAR